MRKLKFRAWDTERSVMAQVNYLGLNDDEVGMEDEECRCWNAPYPYVCKLMQYTGLQDKNGVEIYEGDILVLPSSKTNGVVFYGRGCFQLRSKIDIDILCMYCLEEMQVIGNIYENPELIK